MQIIIFCKNKHYFNYPPRLHLKYVKPQNVNGKPEMANLPNKMRLTAFRNAKGRKRHAKRPPFGTRKTAFYNGVDYQAFTNAWTNPFANSTYTYIYLFSLKAEAMSPKSTNIMLPCSKSSSTVTPQASSCPAKRITLLLTLHS